MMNVCFIANHDECMFKNISYTGELSCACLTADDLPGVVSLVCCCSLLLLVFSGVWRSEVRSVEGPAFVMDLSALASMFILDDCGLSEHKLCTNQK